MKIILALAALLLVATPALSCPVETEEARILEAITPDDTYFVIEGEDLDLFIKNANDLYNIGWQRSTILRVYAIKSQIIAANEHFQAWHLFFIASADGCIAYYQTIYGAVLALVLADDPQAILSGGRR